MHTGDHRDMERDVTGKVAVKHVFIGCRLYNAYEYKDDIPPFLFFFSAPYKKG